MTLPPPEWAVTFIAALHPATVVSAALLPCLRALIRKVRKDTHCWTSVHAAHDFASGLALPSFIALVLSPMIPNAFQHLEGHTLQLAGGLGIMSTIIELFSKDRHSAAASNAVNTLS